VSASARQGLKRILPAKVRTSLRDGRDWLRGLRNDERISRSPDRAVLTEIIFPALIANLPSRPSADILWIGCRRYTRSYYQSLEATGARCWTLDIDPYVERWGRKSRHRTGSLLELDTIFAGFGFDAVLCNGVLGWGVDSQADQVTACRAMAAVTKPHGWLLIGWNTNRIADPVDTGVAASWFSKADLASNGDRFVCDGSTHVYDVLRRDAGAAS
jgi:SAM-dependent methyltransferase